MGIAETSREVIKKPRKAWMRYLMLAAGLALGLLLIAFGSVRSGSKDKNTESDSELMREYAAAVEEKATRLCESTAGVVRGSVTVTVTLGCGYETVYAEDGEKKTASSGTSVSGKYATVGSGSSEQPADKDRDPRSGHCRHRRGMPRRRKRVDARRADGSSFRRVWRGDKQNLYIGEQLRAKFSKKRA